MKKIILVTILLIMAAPSLALGQTTDKKADPQSKVSSEVQIPKGWVARGTNPENYDMRADLTVRHGGKASGHIKSKASATAEGFGTMMQRIKADSYRGKRVRLSAYIKGESVENWAGLWMRVDGEQGDPLSFDNMGNRPIKGTTDWKKYEVVLDVPASSRNIAFGVLLDGKGQVWMDDLQLEVVGQDVASTNLETSAEEKQAMEEYKRAHKDEIERANQAMKEMLKTMPSQTVNLDFEG
jgi:hypothetical protein